MFKLKTLFKLILTFKLVFLLTGCVVVLERTTEPIIEEIEQESELPDWLLLSHRDAQVTLIIENGKFHMTKNLDDEIDKLLAEAESIPESTEEENVDLPEQPISEPMPDDVEDSYRVETESVAETNEQDTNGLTKSQKELASKWKLSNNKEDEKKWWDQESLELSPPQRNDVTLETRGID